MNIDKRRGKILVHSDLFIKLLNLKSSTIVYGAKWEFTSNCYEIYIKDPSLKEIDDGQECPVVNVKLTRIETEYC